MVEILPIKSLRDEDGPIFGSLNVTLGLLARLGIPVPKSFSITAPEFHFKTLLEQYDFGSREVIEQSLTLIRKDIEKITIPPEVVRALGKNKFFLIGEIEINYLERLWVMLLNLWIDEIRIRLWKDGFYQGVTESLEPRVVTVIDKLASFGTATFEPIINEVVVEIKFGKVSPKDLKKLDEVVREANKKLLIPQKYQWILDKDIKLAKVLPYTPNIIPLNTGIQLIEPGSKLDPHLRGDDGRRSAVKVFLDLSKSLTVEKPVDGIYIASEKIFDLNKPQDSFEQLVFKLVESANTFKDVPILFKLADKSEGMGKVRGALRLLHQESLLTPMIEAADFVRHKKGLTNIHLVVPFLRAPSELLNIKRVLASNNLARKSSMELWMEAAVPENIINLEEYLLVGIDGVVLNLDELSSHFSGFDLLHEELTFYKKEVNGLLRFMEDGLRLLHKSKIPFIVTGSLSLYPEMLDFLVEKGVYGVVVERFEAGSAKDLLNQAEKKLIIRRSI